MIPALRNGLRDAAAHWPSALLLYAAVAVPAGIVGYVFQGGFVGAFGRSAALDTLSEGFVYTTIFDLIAKEGYRVSPVGLLSIGFLAVSLPLHSFLTAGLLSALGDRQSWSAPAFFTGAARYFGGFAAISIVSSVVVVFVAALSILAAGSLSGMVEDLSSAFVLAALIPGGLLCAGVITLGDYARIHLVHDPEAGVVQNVRTAAEFLVGHRGVVAAMAAVLAGASLIPLVGAVLFEELVPLSADGWLIPLVVIQQAAVMVRSWVRILAFASLSSFVRGTRGILRAGDPPPSSSPLLTRGI